MEVDVEEKLPWKKKQIYIMFNKKVVGTWEHLLKKLEYFGILGRVVSLL